MKSRKYKNMKVLFKKVVIRMVTYLAFIYSALAKRWATLTMKTNQMAELEQQIPTLSIPAN